MDVLSVIYSPDGNKLQIKCDCGIYILHHMGICLVECKCGNKKWYLKEYEAFNDIFINESSVKWNTYNKNNSSAIE